MNGKYISNMTAEGAEAKAYGHFRLRETKFELNPMKPGLFKKHHPSSDSAHYRGTGHRVRGTASLMIHGMVKL